MLECNQNGVMGHLVYEADGIEIWNTLEKNSEDGWIGIFNRTPEIKKVSPGTEDLGLDTAQTYELENIWEESKVSELDFTINPNGVVFVKYFVR